MSKWSSAYRDSRWQELRLEIMKRDNWSCRSCKCDKDSGKILNVHHVFYESGRAPWEYERETLVTLCDSCHKSVHILQKRMQIEIMKSVVRGGLNPQENVFAMLLGFLHARFIGKSATNDPSYCEGYFRGKVKIPSTGNQENSHEVLANG